MDPYNQYPDDLRTSHYSLRKAIGICGLLLPFTVIFFHGGLLPSISHYYYTKSAVFFIAFMSSFGLFLITYKGYKKDKNSEVLSDNALTIIAGVCALLVALVPTTCNSDTNEVLAKLCESTGPNYLFKHNNTIVGTVHLLSAAIFLTLMGYMSIFRFTKGRSDTPERRKKKLVYKFSGYMVWVCIALLIIEFALKTILKQPNFHITIYDVYILETVAVFFFGLSWLIKGEAIKDLITVKEKIFHKRPD